MPRNCPVLWELPDLLQGLKGILFDLEQFEEITPAQTNQMTVLRAYGQDFNVAYSEVALRQRLVAGCVDEDQLVVRLAKEGALFLIYKRTINLGYEGEKTMSFIIPTLSV